MTRFEIAERLAKKRRLSKTTAARVAALERWVRAQHPYECPEFVVLAPSAVAASYLRWLVSETR